MRRKRGKRRSKRLEREKGEREAVTRAQVVEVSPPEAPMTVLGFGCAEHASPSPLGCGGARAGGTLGDGGWRCERLPLSSLFARSRQRTVKGGRRRHCAASQERCTPPPEPGIRGAATCRLGCAGRRVGSGA